MTGQSLVRVPVFSDESGEARIRDLVLEYCKAYPSLRQDHESLSNLDFNNECGLRIKAPMNWNAHNVIPHVVKVFRSVLVVYNSAENYDLLKQMLPTDGAIEYMSWHEIYFALYNKVRDVRPLQRINSLLNTKESVVVTSAAHVDTEVLYHIQTFCSGCLICLD